MTTAKFLERVKAIADANPTYRTGGDGSDGTCDCIGLIMGAIGKKYDMHSTNYFARFQMRSVDSLLARSRWHWRKQPKAAKIDRTANQPKTN